MIVREHINFKRNNEPKDSMGTGLTLKYLEDQGVRMWWNFPEGPEKRRRAEENIKEIIYFFNLLVKHGVKPEEMVISDYDSIEIKTFMIVTFNRGIFHCLNQKHAQKVIDECTKYIYEPYGPDFKIERDNSTRIRFTDYTKEWLENLEI